jgi:hypothetical protein
MIFLAKLVSSALPNCVFVDEVGVKCFTQLFLSMKLVSNALPDVLMSANHWYWDHTRIDNIFEIVDNIVSGDFMLL